MTEQDALPRFTELVVALGADLGIEDLVPDDENGCGVVIGDNLIAEIELDGDRIVMSAIVGKISPAMAAEWAMELLEANAFWIGTGGATLGVDSASGNVVQCFALPVQGLESDTFNRIFRDFGEAADTWAQRLLTEPVKSSDPPEELMNVFDQRV